VVLDVLLVSVAFSFVVPVGNFVIYCAVAVVVLFVFPYYFR
jgi:hypothetical protein